MQSARDKTASGTVQTATPADSEQSAALLAARQTVLLRSLCELLDQNELHTSVLAFADELHRRFKCDSVSIGLFRGDRLHLEAISRQAVFDARSTEVSQLQAAMVEACDQDRLVHWHAHNSLSGDADSSAHNALAAHLLATELCSIPICHAGERVGAILLARESEKSWSRQTIELMRKVTLLSAPVLSLHLHRETPWHHRVMNHLRRNFGAIFGRSHLLAKMALACLLIVFTGATFVDVTHEVGAEAELLPGYKRTVAAPFPSFIKNVHVSAGDQVAADALLIELDTQELELERSKLNNELKSVQTEMRAAMAAHERKEMAIASARKEQIAAQIALLDTQIDRARITAPESGIVLSEDLRQALGSPVERGEMLLELAPEQGYKAVLWVDESDIVYVDEGQKGQLSLRSSPADGVGFEITTVHPIATASGGANRFRVETQLLSQPQGMRPGHTGYGKIHVGEASAMWTWTHRFSDWLKQVWWEYFG